MRFVRPLSDVVQVGSGSGFPIVDQGRQGEALPFLKVSDMNLPGNERVIAKWNNSISDNVRARLRATAFPAGSVIFPKIGAAIATNKKRVLTCPSCIDNNVMALVPDRRLLEPDYLYYQLLVKDISDFASDSNPPSIRKTTVEAWAIYVPPLERQREIVDVLTRAEGIVRLRREAQTKAKAIIPALFLDMFGNPATNPKGWPLRSVREIVARFEGGKNLQAGSERDTSYRILKVSAATTGRYLEAESKPAPANYEPPANHFVRVGDMLFSRANTQALVGATAIVEATNGRTLLPDKLWRFIWSEPVEQSYMHALFQSEDVRQELGKLSSGTSASMRNISQEKLYQLRLPVAPVEMQRVFRRRADTFQSVIALQSMALATAERTFRALLARSFSDEASVAPAVAAVEAAVA